MKYTATLICVAATTLLATTTAHGRNTVVGFSPHQKPEALKAQVERVVRHLAETLEPGETASLFDAHQVGLIAHFAVPDKKTYANPRAKLQVNRAAIAKLRSFIRTSRAIPGKTGLINMPSFLRTIRKHFPARSGADLIVLGSPIHDDPKAPSLSMVNGRVPGDAHIGVPLSRSPYGTAGLRGTLEGYDVYFGDLGAEWSVSPPHAYRVERLWTLSVEQHGGSLAYFGNDLESLFGLAGKDRPDHRHGEGLATTDKLEMLHFASDNGSVAEIYSRPLAEEPAPEPLWKSASNVTIGITWDVKDVDLDLFVRPKPSAPMIYFNNASTSEGRLFKDFRGSPRSGWETVALNGRIDLSALRIAVNFYAGHTRNGRIAGELRLAIGEQVWAQPFVFNRADGNKGVGAETVGLENKAPNNAWLIFDPLEVIGVK